MAAEVTATATTFDLPQYIGDLFQKNRRPNPTLRLIGGMQGVIRTVGAKQFPMGVSYDVDPGAQQSIVEGANPVLGMQSTSQEENVVQIFQQGVDINYSKQATVAEISGVAVIPGANGSGPLNDPGSLEWQIDKAWEQQQNHINWNFLRGAYQKPANNSTGRQTRGVRSAITTHATDAASAALSKTIIDNHLAAMVDNAAIEMGQTLTVMGGTAALAKLINLYESATQTPESREVVGVAVRRIITKWATLDLVWEPDMAAAELLTWQPALCNVVAMPIPKKGIAFAEPLAHSGATEPWQVYTEMGIDYKSEFFHGVIHTFT